MGLYQDHFEGTGRVDSTIYVSYVEILSLKSVPMPVLKLSHL